MRADVPDIRRTQSAKARQQVAALGESGQQGSRLQDRRQAGLRGGHDLSAPILVEQIPGGGHRLTADDPPARPRGRRIRRIAVTEFPTRNAPRSTPCFVVGIDPLPPSRGVGMNTRTSAKATASLPVGSTKSLGHISGTRCQYATLRKVKYSARHAVDAVGSATWLACVERDEGQVFRGIFVAQLGQLPARESSPQRAELAHLRVWSKKTRVLSFHSLR